MWISTQAFHVAKQGCSEEEYEDACFPEGSFRGEASAYRCAVADGATESAFSKQWANMLVGGFGRHELRLEEQQRMLQQEVAARPLPWYLEAKARRGAHATFVGLSLREAADDESCSCAGKWTAFAVGDSCVFHVRDEQLLDVGPVRGSKDFDSTPDLLCSRSRMKLKRSTTELAILSGKWQANDTFYLATDAMAQWVMAEHEAGNAPWRMLRMQETETFPMIITFLRSVGRMHNDDTTLLRVEVQ